MDALKTDVDKTRTDLEKRVKDIEDRVQAQESRHQPQSQDSERELNIVISKLPETEDEDVKKKVNKLL